MGNWSTCIIPTLGSPPLSTPIIMKFFLISNLLQQLNPVSSLIVVIKLFSLLLIYSCCVGLPDLLKPRVPLCAEYFTLLVFTFSRCTIHMSSYSHIVQWHFKLGIDNFVPPVPLLILNSAIKFLSNYVHCQAKETKVFKKPSFSACRPCHILNLPQVCNLSFPLSMLHPTL